VRVTPSLGDALSTGTAALNHVSIESRRDAYTVDASLCSNAGRGGHVKGLSAQPGTNTRLPFVPSSEVLTHLAHDSY
jgi:hypothetical protein